MRWRRILLIVIGLLVVLPIAGIGIFIATFNPNGWKPRIQNAVMRATGRELSLNGPISVKWSLVPTIEARDVALANFDGGSRPQMVTAQSIEAEVALLPLLSNRLDIPRLAIIKPDILIETTEAGRGNWVFTKPATPTDTPTAAAAPGQPMDIPMDIDIQSMTVEDGTLTWRNGITGQAVTGTLNSFELLEPSETSPVTFQFVATYAGTRFDAKGETGSMARLSDAAAKTPWPVKLTVNSNGAALSVDAQSTTPLQPASYSGKASGQLADLAQLQPFVPGTPLPSVRELSFSANVADSGPLLTRVSEFHASCRGVRPVRLCARADADTGGYSGAAAGSAGHRASRRQLCRRTADHLGDAWCAERADRRAAIPGGRARSRPREPQRRRRARWPIRRAWPGRSLR